MRVLAIDLGRRRVGLAISDPSGTLARPLTTLTIAAGEDAVVKVAAEISQLAEEVDGLRAVVVGVPVRLDGTANDETNYATAFVDRLKTAVDVPVVTADERLTSREAESRLAVNERDWRRRKEKLDAAAAAVILQDYLDSSRP